MLYIQGGSNGTQKKGLEMKLMEEEDVRFSAFSLSTVHLLHMQK